MTIATLIRKTFYWGGPLTVSEVQSIYRGREHGNKFLLFVSGSLISVLILIISFSLQIWGLAST